MKVKIKKLISFLEDNQLELESLVFNKGKLNFQVSENKFQKYSSISNEIVIDDIDKYILPITQEQVNKVIQTVFDGEKQVNIEDEKITDYKFSPIDFNFRYCPQFGYYVNYSSLEETFIMLPSNKEFNSKTRWGFKINNKNEQEIKFYGDMTFKSKEQATDFFIRNRVNIGEDI